MKTLAFTLRNHPIDDLVIEHPDGTPAAITEADARGLGAEDLDIEMARRGFAVEVETCAIEALDTLVHGYGD